MDDAFAAIPPHIQTLISKPGPLTPAEANVLTVYLAHEGQGLPPDLATVVGYKIGTAPTDWQAEASNLDSPGESALTPSSEPSIADRIGSYLSNPPGAANFEGYEGAGPQVDPASGQIASTGPSLLDRIGSFGEGGNAMTRQPGWGDTPPTDTAGQPDLAQQTADARAKRGMSPAPELPRIAGGLRLTPEPSSAPGVTPSGLPANESVLKTVTPPRDLIATFQGVPGEPFSGNPERFEREFDSLQDPDRGGQGDRAVEQVGRDSVGESAFSGVGEGFLFDYANSPELAARAIAEKMGGGAQTAALIMPQVIAGMQLIQSGGFGGRGNKLGPGEGSSAQQLALLEEYIRQGSGLGTSVDPRSTVRDALKRTKRASVDQLQAGAPTSDDPMAGLAQQIETTNGALLAGAGQWGPGAAESLSAKLDEASVQWMQEVATGATTDTYPQYLRKHGAKRWIR